MRPLCQILLLASLCLPLSGQARETIYWCQFDLPPMYIASGPQAGQGGVDDAASFLMKKLPEFEHKWQFSNIARAQADIKSGQPLVCAGMQRNEEREAYALFSEPFNVTLPPRLLLPRSKLALLKPWTNPAGQVRLADVISRSKLNLGVSSGRSYGRVIDEQLAAFKGEPNVFVRHTADRAGEGLIDMMGLGRLDMVLTFASEERLYHEAFRTPGDALVAVPIEGMPRFIPVYVLAPKTELGQRFITRVNGLLRQYWNDPEFRRKAFYGQDTETRARTEALLHEIDPNRKR